MRLFERCVYKTELAPAIRHKTGPDQFAYKEGHNSTMALIKCQHTWLEWLDKEAKYVRVLSFEHLTMCHTVCCLKKLKSYPSIRTL